MLKYTYLTILLIICTWTTVLADQFIVPFDCYPKELQAEFAERGVKLDLDPNERTKDSWGFLKNEGSQHIIYTYRPATEREMMMLLEMYRED